MSLEVAVTLLVGIGALLAYVSQILKSWIEIHHIRSRRMNNGSGSGTSTAEPPDANQDKAARDSKNGNE